MIKRAVLVLMLKAFRSKAAIAGYAGKNATFEISITL